jgi:acyl-CoA synthetase (NDP forming)
VEGAVTTRDLRALFDPQSIAVLGATDTPGKWGFWLAQNALRSLDRRDVYLVNRSGRVLFGQRSYASLRELPGPAELVVISIGADAFEEAIADSLAAGAKAIVAITAGLGEVGGEWLEVERRAVQRVRAAGAVLVGPNCLGIADTSTGVNLAFGDFAPGPVALVSQSGNLALELALVAADRGLGFSRFVSVGNQADLHANELIDDLMMHDATRVIAVYAEDFANGREFVRSALRAHDAGKPVVLLTVGTSRAGARAARSHTGALVSNSVAVDAACRAGGILRVETPLEMIELAQGLLAPRQPRGRRVGIVGDGGGHVALAADLASSLGLELPVLSAKLSAEIASTLPSNAASANPVDLAGGGEQDFFNYSRAVTALARSGEVDAVILTGYFGGYSVEEPELVRREAMVAADMAAGVAANQATLIVQSMYPRAATLDALRAAGVPIYADMRSAALVLSRLAARHEPTGLPDPLPTSPASGGGDGGYFGARALLSRAGVPLVEAREVQGASEAREAAEAIGYPVVLKAIGAEHKSDAGGVRTGIANDGELEIAFADMTARLRPSSFSLEPMADLGSGVELLVGALRDRSFGPLLLVGAGGVFAELLKDVAVALAPVSEEQAEDLIRSLRIAPLLLGARGARHLDVAAAARAAAAISRLAASRPDVSEVEVNPLLVLPEGAIALDARAAY